MRQRIVILGIVLFALTLGLVVFRSLFNSEPAYHGKKLSQWFKQYYRTSQWSGRWDEARHAQAARAFRALGTNAVPLLVTECFTSTREWPLKTNALKFLAELPAPFRFPPFVSAGAVREEAASAIGEIKPPASLLIPLVTNRLNDPDKYHRWMATYLLGKVGEGSEAPVPYLSAKLHSPDDHERTLAALSLDRLGSASHPAVPELIEFVRTNNSFSSYYACRALARVGQAASNAIPVLNQKLVNESNDWKQVYLAVALICIDQRQAEAMALLQTTLTDNQKTNSRLRVIYTLRDIGTNAQVALPLLRTALQDQQQNVWYGALEVLLSLGETNLAISKAQEKLQDSEELARYNASRFLLELQPTNAAAMSNLIQSLHRPALTALVIHEAGRLGSGAKPMIPALQQIVTNQTNYYRNEARNALEIIQAAEVEERMAR